MSMPSVMNHNFSQVPKAEIARSSFDRSHGVKTTFDAGFLIPVFVDEALPGDTFNCRMTAFARLATPLKPIMDNMYLDSFFFAVPYRLVWDNWGKFNGEQRNPGDSTDYVLPTMTPAAYTALSLHDYFGLPLGVSMTHHSLFHRAYNLIWNEWFRDQNLQTSVVVDVDDGPDNSADYVLKRRGKRHDYFTSCLPWPQKGDSVVIPLGTTANVLRTPNATNWTAYNMTTQVGASVGDITVAAGSMVVDGATGISFNPNGGLYADLTTATAATINSLRQAFQIQKMYERDARGGSRYTEIIRSHFGVVSPDARLQRPEYLGGGSTPVNIHPVYNTFSPLGSTGAYGTTSISGHGFVKSFTEHCLIIGMVSVRADLTYQQGLHRMFSRSTRFDFFWPALAHLGEQAVLNKEIYAQGIAADNDVFGYQERYAEYRYKPSVITGEFRSDHATSLDVWHLSQDFSALPVLNSTFIEENPPIDRIIVTPAEPHFLFDSYFKFNCARPMPVYSVPGMIDHF